MSLSSNISEKAALIWAIADKLTGVYKPHEYGEVILPLTVIRRFDCILADTKDAVLDKYESVKALPMKDILLRKASGHAFYNTSKYNFEKLLDDPDNIESNFRDYLNGFSENVQDIIEKFKFDGYITTMANKGILYIVIKEFTSLKANLHPDVISNLEMGYIFEETKTDAGKRKIPITEDVAMMFQAIIEDREPPKMEKVIDGHTGFLFYDDDGNPLVAMHWQHRFNRMVGRYNDIYRVQMPNITPHVCRHTYCSNMAKSGMNPKTLQYLMGHSDISVTMNVYTHISFDDAEEELKRMEEFRKAQAEIEKKNDAKAVSQKMFKVV